MAHILEIRKFWWENFPLMIWTYIWH